MLHYAHDSIFIVLEWPNLFFAGNYLVYYLVTGAFNEVNETTESSLSRGVVCGFQEPSTFVIELFIVININNGTTKP